MNQLFQQLNNQSQYGAQQPLPQQNNASLLNLRQKFQQLKALTNPIDYINKTPEMQNVINLVNQNGGNAKQLFYQLAQQKGVDPNSILDMLK